MKTILIVLLSINLCFASGVEAIKKGDPAPEDGFFVTSEQMVKFREINETKIIIEEKNLKLTQLNIINEEHLKIQQDQYKTLSSEVTWEKTTGNVKSLGFFILGVAATSFAAYAALRSTR